MRRISRRGGSRRWICFDRAVPIGSVRQHRELLRRNDLILEYRNPRRAIPLSDIYADLPTPETDEISATALS